MQCYRDGVEGFQEHTSGFYTIKFASNNPFIRPWDLEYINRSLFLILLITIKFAGNNPWQRIARQSY